MHLFGRPAPLDELAALGLPIARGRGPGVRRPGRRDDGRLLDVQLLPDEEPLRPRGRRPHRVHRRRASPRRCGGSASTAPSTRRPSSSSGRTRASTRSTPRRCASSCRASPGGTAPGARRRSATPSSGSATPSSCRWTTPGTSTTCSSSARPSGTGSPAALGEVGIASASYYVTPLHLQPAMAYLGYEPGSLPETERAAAENLALPMWGGIGPAEQERVVADRTRGRRAWPSRRRVRSPVTRHSIWQVAADAALVAAAWWLAWNLRFDGPARLLRPVPRLGDRPPRRRDQASGLRPLGLLQPLVAVRVDARHVGGAPRRRARLDRGLPRLHPVRRAPRRPSRAASGSSTCCCASRSSRARGCWRGR